MGIVQKIAVITTTRAEYGILKWVIEPLRKHFAVEIYASGTHITDGTKAEIIADGNTVAAEIDIIGLTSADTIANATAKFSAAFAKHKPDLVMILGDRFEMLGVASAALVSKIPVAHLCGGDTTEGAIDEQVRHALTKLSHIHFPSNNESANRIIQMGENPASVYAVGSPALDALSKIKFLPASELSAWLGFDLGDKYIVATYHPATLSSDNLDEVLTAVDEISKPYKIVFTGANIDDGGDTINAKLKEYVAANPNTFFIQSFGHLRYMSALNSASMVLGNSSSGLYEAPSFKIPTINIGDRQKGRLAASSVINCRAIASDIIFSVQMAEKLNCENVVNPYGMGDSGEKIAQILASYGDFKDLLIKQFFIN
jgi:UDP-hydrolysing UDP-N-acetyl-D-glucosamine 2-epimerase